MAPLATVVVVSHRPGDWLAPCLESAVAQTPDVVVVDNGSSGGEASRLARLAGARVVRSRANLGFAGGANLGVRAAKGELVALLNDDATAGPGWLESAAELLADSSVAAVTPKVLLAGQWAEVVLDDEPWFAPGDARPLGRMLRSVTVGGVEVLPRLVGAGVHRLEHGPLGGEEEARWRWTAGPLPFYVPVPAAGSAHPLVVNGEERPLGPLVRVLNHAGSFLRGHGQAGELGLGAPDDGRFDSPAERFGFSATAPVLRAETLRRLGGFAAPFFAYNEDTDWCLRARLAGMRVVYDPRATVSHRLSATSGGLEERRVVHLALRNSLLCLVRNAPARVARELLSRSLREGPRDVSRAVAARLPWALSTRLALRRLRQLPPEEVWRRWADRDCAWDTSPAATRPA